MPVGSEVMCRFRVTGPESEPPFQINISWIHPQTQMSTWISPAATRRDFFFSPSFAAAAVAVPVRRWLIQPTDRCAQRALSEAGVRA